MSYRPALEMKAASPTVYMKFQKINLLEQPSVLAVKN